ncbi:tyrosine-protein phosphatase [uncultured Chryseobacterium sp.]|uniref:tyrosine-protein phosphatase n=1 Tax=uncultured Chryseobacterium sp. TaxID=259322 RepID=UPI0025F2073A|nr:tyrosine-protein phosphatase [uncultured Chryseobacterium sp.]
MKSLPKISFFFAISICIFSCKTQPLSAPEVGKTTTLPEMNVERVYNFRTIGNIKNTEGRTLKKGKLYRSGHLYRLKSRYFETLENLGIKDVIDLRNSKEIAQKPDHIPDGMAYKNESAFEDEGDQLGQARKLVLKGKINSSDAEKKMLDFYRNYVTEHPEVIRKIITGILESDTPVLYHCTAGKDRTGIITALILTILKFDKQTIYNDYLLSNNYREKLVNKRLNLARNLHFIYPKLDIGVLEKLSWVETAYLDAAFNEIDKKYGSTNRYIQEVLKISNDKQEEYLQKFTY